MGEAKRKPAKPKSLRLDGDEVVIAVAVNKQHEHRTWLRGPTTGHTNADMLQLMGIAAVPMIIEIAKWEKVPIQQCLDEAVDLFRESLEKYVHKALTGEYDCGDATTVGLEKLPEQPAGPTGLTPKTSDA